MDEGIGDLALVMREVADLMHATGTTLTLHYDARPPMVLYLHPGLADGRHDALLTECHGMAARVPDQRIEWHGRSDGAGPQAAIIPIERVPGHSRLAITVVFDHLDAQQRERIEALYRERRPFAIGYFRFWQLNRLHMRRSHALEAALDHTELGVMLIDRSGFIIFANKAAEALLDTGDGLSRFNGLLRATNLSDGINLQAALSHVSAADHSGGRTRAPLIAFRRRTGPALVATILPTKTEAQEPGDVAATVYVVDPRFDTAKTLAPLCRLHGLSPVETTLVCHLAAGDTLANAAEKMHIREQTARSYMKQIFIKTNTNRQAELVALMLSSLFRMKENIAQEALTNSAAEKALHRYTG